MRYVYSVVRYVPDPARGEFVNVGAIAGSEVNGDWAIRQIENPKRARNLSSSGSLTAVWEVLDRLGRDLDRYDEAQSGLLESDINIVLDEAWLERLSSKYSRVVQFTQPIPMNADSVESALDFIFDQLIVDPEQKHLKFLRKTSATAAVRAVYNRILPTMPTNIWKQEKVVLKSEHNRQKIDFAIGNGHIIQLAQAFSFQVPEETTISEQLTSWAWSIDRLKEKGGQILVSDQSTIGHRVYEVDKDVDVEVVYVPPKDDQQNETLENAKTIFEDLGVTAVPMERARDVGERIKELIGT